MSANGLHRIRWRRGAVARIHRSVASQLAFETGRSDKS